MQYQQPPRPHTGLNAAILVDFANTKKIAGDLIGESDQTSGILLRLLEETRKYVSRQLGFRTIRMICIDAVPADSAAGTRATGPLLSIGAEPRFVHGTTGGNASAIELTVQAGELLQITPGIDMFVIVSGDRWYVPLAHHVLRNGRDVIVGALETPSESDHVPADLTECYFNTRKLLEKAGRLETNGVPFDLSSGDGFEDETSDVERKPVDMTEIDDPIARGALEIIETYFGQYREVYLTPLLRKLTERLEEEDEPKTVINFLEECGAVWLEKRRGFPHNYTVLLVNEDHPDVIDIKETFRSDGPDNYYDDDAYDDVSEEFVSTEPSLEQARD